MMSKMGDIRPGSNSHGFCAPVCVMNGGIKSGSDFRNDLLKDLNLNVGTGFTDQMFVCFSQNF